MPELGIPRPLLAGRRLNSRAAGRQLTAGAELLETRTMLSADGLMAVDAATIDAAPAQFSSEVPIAEPLLLLPSGNANTDAASLLAAGGPGDPALPGFNNVTRSGDNGTVIYLGAGWAITANHVALTANLNFAGQSYAVDTSTVTRLRNTDGTNTDLKMFKIDGEPPLPNLFNEFIASAPPSGHVFMIGNGLMASSEKFWSVNKTQTPWVWTEIDEPSKPGTSNYAGVTVSSPRTVRWGENNIHDTGLYMPISGSNVAGFTTRFDELPYTNQAGLANEAQAAAGDSGGAVFALQNGKWVLSGIMIAVSGSLSGQPSNTALYGNITFAADLSAYRTQILAVAGVVGQHLFYNNSAYDNNTPGVSPADDLAIATDKFAYQAGDGTSTFNSVSSYTRGINGIAIDLASVHGTLTAADFSFKMGTTNDPNAWNTAPAPSIISVRPGAGVGGSDRVELIWPDNQIEQTWLQVTVRGNDTVGGFNTNTGMNTSNVFYFGHRPGDAGGNPAALAITSALDEVETRQNPGFSVEVTSAYDFDRNQIVSASDQIIARTSAGFLPMINLEAPVAAGSLAEEEPLTSTIETVDLNWLTPDPMPAPVVAVEHSPALEQVFAELGKKKPSFSSLFSAFSGFHFRRSRDR